MVIHLVATIFVDQKLMNAKKDTVVVYSRKQYIDVDV